MIWTKVLSLLACLAASGLSLPAHATVTLAFGVYASDKPTAMVRQFRPILNVLESRLTKLMGEPVTIRMQIATTYEQGVDDLVSGRVDFARFGPASYIEAKNANPGVSILVVESNKGTKIFKGVICVMKDSPIQSVSELVGQSFAFGNERSTIGRYLSQMFLLRHNVRAFDLRYYEYLERHDAVGFAVGAGRFDAGALKEGTFKKMVAQGVPIRAIATFPNVTKPWIVRSGLPETIEEVLRETLLTFTDAEALKALKKSGFLEGSDADYAFIREAIFSNHLFFQGYHQNANQAPRADDGGS